MLLERTSCGFNYGAAKISAVCSDEKKGWVIVDVTTPKKSFQVYVTKTGKIRVFDNKTNKELK